MSEPQMGPHRRKLPVPLERSVVVDVQRRRRLSVHPTGSTTAAFGTEPDGEQCEAAVEPDVSCSDEE